jgi:hypothetical protein
MLSFITPRKPSANEGIVDQLKVLDQRSKLSQQPQVQITIALVGCACNQVKVSQHPLVSNNRFNLPNLLQEISFEIVFMRPIDARDGPAAVVIPVHHTFGYGEPAAQRPRVDSDMKITRAGNQNAATCTNLWEKNEIVPKLWPQHFDHKSSG